LQSKLKKSIFFCYCYVTKYVFLSAKADTDRTASEAEMKELERQISHDRKLRDFMKLKAQERQEDEELVIYRKRKGLFFNMIV